MSEAEQRRMTADEYLVWSEGQPGRHELWHGEVVAMAAEQVIHVRLKFQVAGLLREEIHRAGLPCEAFADGLAVRIDDNVVFEPDALVRCGGRELLGRELFITDPIVVVEVSSPSTQEYDADAKLEGYFRLASVRHYVIVRPTTQVLIHHERRANGEILTHIIRDGRLVLDPPGIRIEDVFAA